MPNRSAPKATNLKPAGEKNVRDPSEHPMGVADSPKSTGKRGATTGDAKMRLPHEHDETGDKQERARGTDKLMEQAASDATGEQQDTDRRSDAVENFDHGQPPRSRRGKIR